MTARSTSVGVGVTKPLPRSNPTGHCNKSSTDLGTKTRTRTTMSTLFSPRNSNYERLEGGMGPSRLGGVRAFGWKKFAIGAVVLIALVYVFGPRREDILPEGYIPCEYIRRLSIS